MTDETSLQEALTAQAAYRQLMFRHAQALLGAEPRCPQPSEKARQLSELVATFPGVCAAGKEHMAKVLSVLAGEEVTVSVTKIQYEPGTFFVFARPKTGDLIVYLCLEVGRSRGISRELGTLSGSGFFQGFWGLDTKVEPATAEQVADLLCALPADRLALVLRRDWAGLLAMAKGQVRG